MLWLAQIGAIIRLEWKKTFFAKRGLWVYLLALAPVALIGAHAIAVWTGLQRQPCDFGEDTLIFAGIFQFFFLRVAVFFGCLGIFMNLIRGEMLDRSLHYYLLAPIRREVLLAGKFLAGLLAACVIFGGSALAQFTLMYAHQDPVMLREYMFHGQGFQHAFAYLGSTLLACIGYGSVFMTAGVIMRNPVVPAAAILVWESINAFLPTLLQKFSIIYYLKSLCPVSAPPDVPPPFSFMVVNADPVSPITAVAGLLAVTAIVLAYAALRIRRLEINYASD